MKTKKDETMRKYVCVVIAALLLAMIVLFVRHLTGQIRNERARSAELEGNLRTENMHSAELAERLHAENTRTTELEASLSAERARSADLTGKLRVEAKRVAEATDKLNVESRRFAELKNMFHMYEWTASIHTKSMVYVYGSAGDTLPRETEGGMSFTPEANTIYIWPNEGREFMWLSNKNGSRIPFPDECGACFHPVTPYPILVPGKTIRLMEGVGPSKGYSLWIRIVELPRTNTQ